MKRSWTNSLLLDRERRINLKNCFLRLMHWLVFLNCISWLRDIAVVKLILAKERRISHVEVFDSGSVMLIYFDYISSNKWYIRCSIENTDLQNAVVILLHSLSFFSSLPLVLVFFSWQQVGVLLTESILGSHRDNVNGRQAAPFSSFLLCPRLSLFLLMDPAGKPGLR